MNSHDIARALGLPVVGVLPRSANGGELRRCQTYLLERPLSVAPLIVPMMRAGGVPETAQRRILTMLETFRAAVRGLDDLLDSTDCDPAGRIAAWRLFGPRATAQAALCLWQKAVDNEHNPFLRQTLIHESACMVRAAELEEFVRRIPRDQMQPVSVLAAVERRIRDKEWAYWRLIAGFIGAHWRASHAAWQRGSALLYALADNWQRLDDARDFAGDVAGSRLSSFIVDVLQAPLPWDVPPMIKADAKADANGDAGAVPAAGPLQSWTHNIDDLIQRQGAAVERFRQLRLCQLERETTAISRALGNLTAGVDGPNMSMSSTLASSTLASSTLASSKIYPTALDRDNGVAAVDVGAMYCYAVGREGEAQQWQIMMQTQ